MRAVRLSRVGWLAGLMVLVGAVLGGCGEDGPVELPPLELAPALGGERYAEPVEIGTYPDGRLFLAERAGRVLLVSEEDPAGAVLLEITDRVDDDYGEGLLSVALDPGFESNGFVWVYYFAEGDPDQTLLSRFSVAGDVADPASELVALALEQPGFNQNGGAIRFGPDDGMLYLSLGDGSASTDPFMNGQNLGTLLGTVIRIDVREASEAEPYRVPSDNPFVETAGARPEIWAYGLRNPWRMTIDAESGEMWLGDVQVSTEEEVDRVERGDNLGWSVMEGAGCLSRTGCDPDGYVLPRATYPHGEGRCAVIGGVVYRGEAIEALAGRYLYGDFCSGRMWALDREGGTAPELIADLEGQLTSFGTDADEEVLVLDIDGGGVYRLREAE